MSESSSLSCMHGVSGFAGLDGYNAHVSLFALRSCDFWCHPLVNLRDCAHAVCVGRIVAQQRREINSSWLRQRLFVTKHSHSVLYITAMSLFVHVTYASRGSTELKKIAMLSSRLYNRVAAFAARIKSASTLQIANAAAATPACTARILVVGASPIYLLKIVYPRKMSVLLLAHA